VAIELALQSHGPFTFAYDIQWQDNPYNRSEGGPLAHPGQVLRDPVARRWLANRLRYGAARWGGSPALFGWTLWIEINQVERDAAVLADWHREAAAVLAASDVGRHPVSAEFTTSAGIREVWQLPGIDYVQAPAYNFRHGITPAIDNVVRDLPGYAKPVLVEEYAGHCEGGDPRWIAHEIHDGLWLGWTRPLAGTPMAWWWNFIFANRLERFHARFAAFIRDQDLRGLAWRYPRGTVAGVPGLRFAARATADRADIWLHGAASDVGYSGWPQAGGGAWRRRVGGFDPLAEDPGRLFSVPEGTAFDLAPLGLGDGSYQVEVWDTWSDRAAIALRAEVRGGKGVLALPALSRDAAIRIRRIEAVGR
jgi:hypothetical protein